MEKIMEKIMMKKKINFVVNKVIEWASGNSAGLIMDRFAIREVACSLHSNLSENDIEYINKIMGKFESEFGYLVKASDFKSAFELYYKTIYKTDE